MGKGRAAVDDYFKLSLIILCPVACLLFIGLGYEISKIIIGSLYLHACNIEKLIPVYLIVSGVLPVFLGGFFRKEDDGRNTWTVCGLFGFLLNLAWLICGSVWVFSNFGKLAAVDFKQCGVNTTTDCMEDVCNKHVITFAFATLIIDWFFFSFWICFVLYLVGKLSRRY